MKELGVLGIHYKSLVFSVLDSIQIHPSSLSLRYAAFRGRRLVCILLDPFFTLS